MAEHFNGTATLPQTCHACNGTGQKTTGVHILQSPKYDGILCEAS
jgi:hypothetical protein